MISRKKKGEAELITKEEMDTIEVAAIAGTPLTGDQMLAEATEEVTMDRFLDRSPKLGEPIDWPAFVKVLHRKREMFITAEANKRSGVKEEEPTE